MTTNRSNAFSDLSCIPPSSSHTKLRVKETHVFLAYMIVSWLQVNIWFFADKTSGWVLVDPPCWPSILEVRVSSSFFALGFSCYWNSSISSFSWTMIVHDLRGWNARFVVPSIALDLRAKVNIFCASMSVNMFPFSAINYINYITVASQLIEIFLLSANT